MIPSTIHPSLIIPSTMQCTTKTILNKIPLRVLVSTIVEVEHGIAGDMNIQLVKNNELESPTLKGPRFGEP